MSSNTVISTDNITHVFHIADLHIRRGDHARARITEYNEVFNTFINQIKDHISVKNKTALLIIAGDVFHDKYRIESEGLALFFEFINKVMELMPVIIICGNHDYLQDAPDAMDMIESAVRAYPDSAPVYYITDSGLYEYGPLGIGLVSIKDTLRTTAYSGIVDELPAYPDFNDFSDNIKCRAALFHGSISQSALPNERMLMGGYPLEWFKGYDWGIFGDNHKQQLHYGLDNTFLWGYPGSLIQQDDGEPTFGHGYICWEIATKRAEVFHVPNEYGSITMRRMKNGEYQVRFGPNKMTNIHNAVCEIPKKAKVRIVGSTSDITQICDLLTSFKITPISVYNKTVGKTVFNDEEIITKESEIINFSDLNQKSKWIEYVVKTAEDASIIEYIENPQNILMTGSASMPIDISRDIIDRNKQIQQTIDGYDNAIKNIEVKSSKIIFKYMKWSYLMPYGETNYFDFALNRGKIALINGPNATGKSAFLDIICIALYGQPTTNRSMVESRKESIHIINNQKPHGSRSFVMLVFEIDGVLYEIQRSFSKHQQHDHISRMYDVILSSVDTSGKTNIIAEKTKANDWLIEKLGNINDLLMSTVLCQMDTDNFFMQPWRRQIELIDAALNMNSITEYQNVLKESVNAHNFIARKLETHLKGMVDNTSDTNITSDIMAELKTKLDKITLKEERYTKRANEYLGRVGDPSSIKDKDNILLPVLERNLVKIQERLDEFNDIDMTQRDKALEFKGRYTVEKAEIQSRLTGISLETIDIDKMRNDLAKLTIPKDSPNMSIENIEKRIKSYNKWLNEQSQEFLDDLDNLEIYRDDLKVKIDELEIEYAEWEVCTIRCPRSVPDNAPNTLRNIEDIQNEIEILEKKINRYERKNPMKPNMSRELIEKRKKDYDPTLDYDTCVSEIYSINCALYNISEFILPSSSACLTVNWLEMFEMRKTLLASPIIPCREKSGYFKWKSAYDEWYNKIKKYMNGYSIVELRKIKQAYADIEKYEEQIELIDIDINMMSHIKFNPDCEACMNNPTHLSLESKRIQKQDLNKKIKKLKKIAEAGIDIDVIMEGRQYYENTETYMTSENLKWINAEKEWIAKDKWLNEIHSIEIILGNHAFALRARMALLQNVVDMKEVKDEIELWKIQDQRDEYQKQLRILEWEEWMAYDNYMNDMRTRLCKLRSDYSKVIVFLEEYERRTSECHEAEHDKKIYDHHILWTKLKKQIDEYDLYNRLLILESQYDENQTLFDRLDAYEVTKNEFARIQRLIYYNHWCEASAALLEVKNIANEIRREYFQKEKEYLDSKNHNAKILGYREYLKNTREKLARLIMLQEAFSGGSGTDGFKSYIYKHEVIGLIEREVNRFLSLIENIELKLEYNNGAFIYYVADRGSRPTLDNASGYQKFIIGLAMRMALSRMGSVGQNVKHLFIDEGFVSFDANNIEKSTDILRSMMTIGEYDSIYIVSHLEAIRDLAEVRVNIERDSESNFSALRYGGAYPIKPVVKKTRVKK